MADTLKSRNTIQLPSSASSVTDYYKDYVIEVTRLYKATGKKSVQRATIVGYSGSTKIATISTLWLDDLIPGPEDSTKKDTYRIIPKYADKRISINPAIQTLDYVSSEKYGRGLDAYKDLYLPSWLESARLCDAQSDVTVETTSVGTTAIGARYRYPASGDILFQGDVTSITGNFVRFTNVLGKLTNKWNSWKSYPASAIVYDETRVYLVTVAGTQPTRPSHTSGTVAGLQYISSLSLTKVSGTGPSTLGLKTDGNPVRALKNGSVVTGYSLYDADGVDYWRYLGWDEHSQRNVTQHQTNVTIDTSLSLFDNVNSLLEHYGGMMRYTAGKYHLEIEDGEGNFSDTGDPRRITTDDILSKIKISDDGIRGSYNSLTVAFADPANKFEARNISFFNSDYLRADRNVPTKGSLTVPGITNYYNARLLSERFLTKSRFGLTVSFNMTPKGVLLVAGRVIEIPYARYGWDNKKFRITNMTHNTDCTVDVVAEEYDDSFYQIKAVMQAPSAGLGGSAGNSTLAPPQNITATNVTSGNEIISAIQLNWIDTEASTTGGVITEIFSSYSPHLYITVTAIASGTTFTSVGHQLTVDSVITPTADGNGLFAGLKYYVRNVTADTFTLAPEKGGVTLNTFVNGTGLAIQFQTANAIATVYPPQNNYLDTSLGSSQTRVQKYYWLRYRVDE
jgi:hypothetical protein